MQALRQITAAPLERDDDGVFAVIRTQDDDWQSRPTRRGGRSLARNFAFSQMKARASTLAVWLARCQPQRERIPSRATSRPCIVCMRPRESIVESKQRDDVTAVYFLRSVRYQFCNCGVLLRSCMSMLDLH